MLPPEHMGIPGFGQRGAATAQARQGSDCGSFERLNRALFRFP